MIFIILFGFLLGLLPFIAIFIIVKTQYVLKYLQKYTTKLMIEKMQQRTSLDEQINSHEKCCIELPHQEKLNCFIYIEEVISNSVN